MKKIIILLFGILLSTILISCGEENKDLNKDKEQTPQELELFNPDNYALLEDYISSLVNNCGTDINLLESPFYIKIKKGKIEKIQKIDLKNVDYTKLDKNSIIRDINKACESNNIYDEGVFERVDITTVSENAKFVKDLMSGGKKDVDWLKYKKELENKKDISLDEIKKLGFMYEVEGNYDLKNKLCIEKKSCEKDTLVKISGIIKDQESDIIPGAKIYLINDSSISTISNEKGEYSLELKTNELSALRLRVTKDNYSDSITNIYSIVEIKEFNFNRDFILAKPLKIQKITKNDFIDKKIELSGNISNYELDTDGLVDKDGNKIKPQDIVVNIFEYNRSNTAGLGNYFNLDIFDNSGNYVGDTFVTYGMPYLTLKDENGEEIFISKKNPAKLIDNIANLDDLIKEKQDISGNQTLTKSDLVKMVSKNEFIYLSDYAKENNIIMPYKWNLNIQKGVWEESSVKFIDSTNGKAETIYYNVN